MAYKKHRGRHMWLSLANDKVVEEWIRTEDPYCFVVTVREHRMCNKCGLKRDEIHITHEITQ